MGILDFYKGKRVFVTGHTGFKGSWMCAVLLNAGCDVTGYSLRAGESIVNNKITGDIQNGDSLFRILKLDEESDVVNPENVLAGVFGNEGSQSIESEKKYNQPGNRYKGTLKNYYGDIRDFASLKEAFDDAQPEIVIHMAAQPIVRTSYIDPKGTYETNVLGTVNILECIRLSDCVKCFVNVTTDKVYQNFERMSGYKEDEILNGYDPYSNSKSCSELVTDSYRKAFLEEKGIKVATMRAGNVIGGGDFAINRIIPDCVRSAYAGEDIVVRNPDSIRPYQHVLEPVIVYLTMAVELYNESDASKMHRTILKYVGAYNIGPDDEDTVKTADIATMFCKKWNEYKNGYSFNNGCDCKSETEKKEIEKKEVCWVNKSDGGPHEANLLRLDCSKIKKVLGWSPKWHIDTVMDKIVEWYKAYESGDDMIEVTNRQIEEYLSEL